MADLNRKLINISEKTSKLQNDILDLLRGYDDLFQEANRIYMSERMSSDNSGLEDFQLLVRTIRRNRDVIGSIYKGITNIRPTEKFKFIEEEVRPQPKLPRRERKNKSYIDVPLAETEIFEEVKEPEVITNG